MSEGSFYEVQDSEHVGRLFKRSLKEMKIKRHSIRQFLKANSRKFFAIPQIATAINESTGIVLEGLASMKKDKEVIEKKIRVQRKKDFLNVPFYSYKKKS